MREGSSIHTFKIFSQNLRGGSAPVEGPGFLGPGGGYGPLAFNINRGVELTQQKEWHGRFLFYRRCLFARTTIFVMRKTCGVIGCSEPVSGRETLTGFNPSISRSANHGRGL
jgi:hypothetical protein